MTLTIELPEAVERRLAERAAHEGKTVESVAIELIREGIGREKTFAEILAPVRQEFAESGMTEEEFDKLIEEAREELWQEEQETWNNPVGSPAAFNFILVIEHDESATVPVAECSDRANDGSPNPPATNNP